MMRGFSTVDSTAETATVEVGVAVDKNDDSATVTPHTLLDFALFDRKTRLLH